jgi:hypothetical protein
VLRLRGDCLKGFKEKSDQNDVIDVVFGAAPGPLAFQLVANVAEQVSVRACIIGSRACRPPSSVVLAMQSSTGLCCSKQLCRKSGHIKKSPAKAANGIVKDQQVSRTARLPRVAYGMDSTKEHSIQVCPERAARWMALGAMLTLLANS